MRATGVGLRQGHRLGAYRGGQLEFHDYRAYVPGDDLRYLDWNLYARMEDVVVVTDTGIENFTDFLPGKPDDIEKLMREPGILQLRAPTKP